MLRCASETCRPIYRIIHLDTCDTIKRDDWLEWRKEKKTVPTSSTLCAYFGHGFISLNKVLHERIFDNQVEVEQPPKKPTDYNTLFSERAKAHGTKFEINAKKLFKKYLKKNKKIGDIYKYVGSGEVSHHSSISYDNEAVEVICTPDDLYLFSNAESWGRMVVEYKCPYKVLVERGDKSVLHVVTDFTDKYNKGKESAFVQAGTYALWCQAHVFYTVFFFTDGIDEEYIIVFKYKPSPELYTELFEALKETQEYLNQLNDIRPNQPLPQFRTKSNKKKTLTRLMNLCYESTFIYSSLDE